MSAKINYEAYRLGTKDGEIKFGHISDNQQIYSVYLNNYMTADKHYIAMVQTGELDWQRDSTLCRSMGSFSVIAGDRAKDGTPSIDLTANSGDIILSAPSGRIKLMAKDIEFIASGDTGETGNIRMKANEKIVLDAGQIVDIHAKVSIKIVSDKDVETIARGILNLIGNFVNMTDGNDVGCAAVGRIRKGGSVTDAREAAANMTGG
tara:strand:+ start:8186 stop:8803 length:618 start_codon:yes stop_codon:yes gene_type:complete